MVQKNIFILYLLLLSSVCLFSQKKSPAVKERVIGTWKKINPTGSVYTEELEFIDRKHCKSIVINHPAYSNVTQESLFKYKLNKYGTGITFTSTDPKNPETNQRFIRFASDTLIISVRSGIYSETNEYIRK